MIERRATSTDQLLSVISIHLDSNCERTLRSAVAAAGGVSLVGEFQQYFGEKDASLVRAIREHRPDVCIVDFDRNRELAMQTVEYMRRSMRRDMAIFAVSSSVDADSIIGAMRCGCTEYLTQPLQVARLTEALSQLQRKRRDGMAPAIQGKLIAFMGVKGGVGVTTIAVHLASYIARNQRRTMLIDAHADLGDTTLHLGLEHHNYGFYELVHNLSRLDAELLQGFVMKHESGLDVLLSPESFVTPAQVGSDAVVLTLKSLVRMYDDVLVDCGPGLSDVNMAILEATDELYLVTTPDLPAVRNLVRYLDYVGRLIPASKIKIVVSRTTKTSAIANDHIEKVTKQKISVTVPFAGIELSDAIGTGIPVPLRSKSDFAQSIARWATQTAGQQAEATSKADTRGNEGKSRFSMLRLSD